MDNNQTLTVNGPINGIRVDGTIFGIKKILYLFMDYHAPTNEETECNNLLSDDFHKHLMLTFKNNPTIIYDFFLEQHASLSLTSNSDMRERYIDEVGKVFNQEFKYDPATDTVFPTKSFPNVRFHYMDLRDFFNYTMNPLLRDIQYNIESLNLSAALQEETIRSIENDLEDLQSELEKIYDLMYKKQNTVARYTNKKRSKSKKNKVGGARVIGPTTNKERSVEANEGILVNFVDKMYNRYNHPEVKKVMIDFMNGYIKNTMDKTMHLVNETLEYIEGIYPLFKITVRDLTATETVLGKVNGYGIDPKVIRRKIFDLQNYFEEISNAMLVIFIFLIDIYFLRRFLDKDYVSNGIVYTGGLHSMHYIYILVKFFDFKVTNASYSEIKDMQTLNSVLKDLDISADEIGLHKLFFPPRLLQCTDLTNFPPAFT